MKLKSRYKLVYTLDKEPNELILDVEIKQNEGYLKPGQNIWYGSAILNGKPYTEEDLSHCVDASLAARKISRNIVRDIKLQAKKLGQVFRIKNESTT